MNPDIGFAITVNDKDYERATILASAGLRAWCGDEDMRKECFPSLEEDDDYWYATGYQEPVEDLFKKDGITGYSFETCFDEGGDFLPGFENKIEEVI